MDKRSVERIMKIADKKEFKDEAYCNDVILSLCNELLAKNEQVNQLKYELENQPITYPHQCFVLEVNEKVMVFTHKNEAEMFKLETGIGGLVKTTELFSDHRRAAFKLQSNFLLTK